MSIAFVLVHGPELPRVTYLTQPWVHGLVRRVAGYLDAQSGGRAALEWRVFDWYQVPLSAADWDGLAWGLGPTVEPMAARDLAANLADYDHVAFVIDQWNSHSAAWNADNRRYLHISAQDLTPALLAHELGHMYGTNHANASDPSGTRVEYGDSFCVMGAEGGKASFVDTTHSFRLEFGQPDWRFCNLCSGLFFDGFPMKGTCPGSLIPDTGHRPAGFNFVLQHDQPPGEKQADWRFCEKCFLLFFDGADTNGVCPTGGEHAAAGFTFVLPHDLPPGPGQQDWRFCHRCMAMFFDGFPDKGDCAAGGAHEAAGFNFALPHDLNDHNVSGPGMVASTLSATGWLDVSQNGVDVSQLAGRPSETTVHIAALAGVPLAGDSRPVVAWADGLNGERVLIEHRVREEWDAGLRDSLPGFGGWVLVHLASGSPTGTSSTIIRAFPAEVDGTAWVDEAALRITVAARDDASHTVTLRLASSPALPADRQANWRFCRFCQTLFYDGFFGKGPCPAGGNHAAIGFLFSLPHDTDLPSAQRDWRFCTQCNALFFDGASTKGTCRGGTSGHTAAGFNFAVPHDIADAGQNQWRFCDKCFQMFYDGFATKGLCPASGGHNAAGFDFVLPVM